MPSFAKTYCKKWKTASIDEVSATLKNYLPNLKGNKYNELFEFIYDFSNTVYEHQETNTEKESTLTDESTERILSVIKSILLPHLKVLDKMQNTNEKLTFTDQFQEPFSDTLANKVKERDIWKCVICQDFSNIQVMHIIPQSLGGINHKDNLVTLCPSCINALENLNVQEAFQKCLSNYQNLSIRNHFEYRSINKNSLKKDVERTLDDLIKQCQQKNEQKMLK